MCFWRERDVVGITYSGESRTPVDPNVRLKTNLPATRSAHADVTRAAVTAETTLVG